MRTVLNHHLPLDLFTMAAGSELWLASAVPTLEVGCECPQADCLV